MGSKLLVTYLDHDGSWEKVAPVLRSKLPLVNVEWTNPTESHRGPRTLPSLALELVRFTPEVFPKNVPGMNLHEGPFLHLYFLECEEVDVYRKQSRKAIQDWIALMNSKRNQEWLIVFVTKQEAKAGSSFLRSSTVLDKLRSDFNTSKRDRVTCLQANAAGDFFDAEGWRDALTKLTGGVLATLSNVVSQYDETIKRLEAQRLMPGWNYCQFFVIKEGLASTYEMVGLYDDALLQCDELELSFYQTLAEQGAPWFRTFGGTDMGDDSADILDVSRKPYRDMIAQNRTSIFDLRIYLFARQMQLLFHLKLLVNICLKAKAFITAFSRTLTSYEVALVPCFGMTWVFSSCLNVVERCDALAASLRFPASTVVAYESIKAELLHLARLQLDKIGSLRGFLSQPSEIASGVTGPLTPPGDDEDSACDKITRPDLRQACESEAEFDRLYKDLSDRTIASFQRSGRFRSMWLLKGDIASLSFDRKDYVAAAEILEDMCNRYAQSGWDASDYDLLEKLATCQKMLGDLEQYTVSVLRLLEILPREPLDRRMHYEDQLGSAAGALARDLVRESEFVFHVEVLGLASPPGFSENTAINLRVHNHFVASFIVDAVHLHLLAAGMGETSMRSGTALVLQPGATELAVRSFKPLPPGSYTVEKIVLVKGRLHLVYNLLQADIKFTFTINKPPICIPCFGWSLRQNEEVKAVLRLHVVDSSLHNGRLRCKMVDPTSWGSVHLAIIDAQGVASPTQDVGSLDEVILPDVRPQCAIELTMQARGRELSEALPLALTWLAESEHRYQDWDQDLPLLVGVSCQVLEENQITSVVLTCGSPHVGLYVNSVASHGMAMPRGGLQAFLCPGDCYEVTLVRGDVETEGRKERRKSWECYALIIHLPPWQPSWFLSSRLFQKPLLCTFWHSLSITKPQITSNLTCAHLSLNSCKVHWITRVLCSVATPRCSQAFGII
ncbi:hypothetical protein DFJ74DRAFT_649156 [Hyaloraphidium curvatum]|nr:hypothetical protein DFJ74DRAFT_649156 [Hyaloraphidium curvatum]